jgi:Tfp pilus assembly protein PilX
MNKLMQHTSHRHKQRGVVSILTVLMFSILIAVLLAGFTRLMMQERQETLQDDLSKSAYNSAQAGIEDAKRAIQFCGANPTSVAAGFDCSKLYNPTCPGFNAGGAFTGLGIPDADASASGTPVGDAAVNQRYTCVIVSLAREIETDLGGPGSSSNSALYKLDSGGVAFDTVKISWAKSNQYSDLPDKATVQNNSTHVGNKRVPDWLTAGYPAALRMSLIAADASFASSDTLPQRQAFLFPIRSGAVDTISFAGADAAIPSRYFRCTDGLTYACSASVDMTGAPAANRYIALQAFYRATSVSIELFNGAAPVAIKGEQTIIDATGAAANLFRRVEVRVKIGNPMGVNAALDTGGPVCKNFFVSPISFTNDPECAIP